MVSIAATAEVLQFPIRQQFASVGERELSLLEADFLIAVGSGVSAHVEPWVADRPKLHSLSEINDSQLLVQTPHSEVIVISQTPEDQLVSKRADRLIKAAASMAVKAEAQIIKQSEEQSARTYSSLAEAIYWAAKGDETARKLIETNVRTDMIERTYKSGNVVEIKLDVNEDMKIVQYGQTLDDVHINGLRYASATPEMRERAEAEARNSVRIENEYRKGALKDNYFVVISRFADNLTDEQAADIGFFVDTKSCAIQVTTESAEGLMQESAFVAGVYELGGAQHDEQTVNKLAQTFGVSFEAKSAAEIIDMPMLIPKWMMPNGVIDLVKIYDKLAGGTFYGENKASQDYIMHKEFCRDRERKLDTSVQTVTNQLIAEHNELSKDPRAPVPRLNRLSQEVMVDRAIEDKSIDSRVFGPAAQHIEIARQAYESGNFEVLRSERDRAQQNAVSSSCPAALLDSKKYTNSANGEVKNDNCSFISKKCPLCGTKDVLTTVTATHIKGSCGCSKKKD